MRLHSSEGLMLRQPQLRIAAQIPGKIHSRSALRTEAPSQPLEPALAAQAFSVSWASCEADVRAAQRLRHLVFVDEMGARPIPPPGTPDGIDADRFDSFCDHLLVRAGTTDGGHAGPVIGTYRVLGPDAARRAGGLYSDGEFDLGPLDCLRPRAVELGRSCVHPAWRSGGVILALWAALAQYMRQHELDTMIGCASVGIDDGGDAARRLWLRLRAQHQVAPHWRVRPYAPLRVDCRSGDSPDDTAGLPAAGTPPLIKGYLRCGAQLLGPPALDTAFNTADLPMLMRIADLAPRYRKHLLGA
jgi:putative hemolysin